MLLQMKKTSKTKTVRCPYCAAAAVLRDGSYVHGEMNRGGKLYVCARFPACNAYVGAYANHKPMGTLADGNLRHKRIETHRLFDRLWKQGIMSRSGAYNWMRAKFGMSADQAHIAQFSEYMCEALMTECRKALDANSRLIA
jgi:hypothetical protein